MKNTLKILIAALLCFQSLAQSPLPTTLSEADALKKDNIEIKKVMLAQERAWNQHDLEGFMDGYWKNDSLKFYGSSGLTYGWDKTLANYKKSYPTKAETGQLKFVIQELTQISQHNYWVMGEYHLTRTIGNANGVFMIIFRKIDGQWKIIADMSC